MTFNHLNGDFDAGDNRKQALVYNTLLEQLIRIRADVSALHGCVQVLATKQGISVEQMQAMRVSLRDTSYEIVCADVLKQLRGGDASGAAPQQP
jgi:hypothetical protein